MLSYVFSICRMSLNKKMRFENRKHNWVVKKRVYSFEIMPNTFVNAWLLILKEEKAVKL